MNLIFIYFLGWIVFEVFMFFLVYRKINKGKLKAGLKYPGTIHSSLLKNAPWWFYAQIPISLLIIIIFTIKHFIL